MKLLLVDDEVLTRQGLLDAVDWKSLGITEIRQADDGINGLALALEFQPAIILSDVRMPRLSGIDMAKKLEKQLPLTELVFMSGYSDKEYLKAAIKLQAVSYIEKPINHKELFEAILEAKQRYQAKESNQKSATAYLDTLRTHLAILLTKPFDDVASQIEPLQAQLDCTTPIYITAYALRTERKAIPNGISLQLRRHLESQDIQLLTTGFSRGACTFFALSKQSLRPSTQGQIATQIHNLFSPHCALHLGYAPAPKGGWCHGHSAYVSALALVEHCFFLPQCPILEQSTWDTLPKSTQIHQDMASRLSAFSQHLTERKQAEAQSHLVQLLAYYESNQQESIQKTVELYYRHMLTIQEVMEHTQLETSTLFPQEDLPISEQLAGQLTLQELHRLLAEKTKGFFRLLDNRVSQSSTIFLIKDFISKHYCDENLSAKEIADFVDFSMAYLCTYFKSQTGQTPNQYLTEYRMEKAKQLLADGRNRVTEISALVGYRDGNYFSKSFRKYTGLSPSQYREQVML